LDDFGQWLLGDIEKITFPRLKKQVGRSQTLVQISCAHGTAEITSPLSGTVVEINEEVCRDCSLISTDPYGEGWLMKLLLAKDESDRLKQQGEMLLSPSEARRWLKTEVDRLHYVLETEVGVTMSDGGQLTSNLLVAITKEQWDLLIKTFVGRKEG
jgi:glycine cleavage system H protein